MLTAACFSSRRAQACDPAVTPSRSVLAWGPARGATTSEPLGRVIDVETGLPVRDALVSVDAGRHGAFTDSLGQFPIPRLSQGMHLVRVQKIGYATARDSVKVGMGGLRLFAALAPHLGIVDFVCTSSIRSPREG